MKPGDVVEMKSAVIQFGNPKARGSVTIKATPGRHMLFMCVGSIDAKGEEKFNGNDFMRSMGWIPGPELQADLDKEPK